MLRAFGHPIATCSDKLRVENWTSAHAQVQHCCTNLAKRLQHHATSTIVAWKIWLFSNLSQQHPTCRNTSQQGGQTHATCCAQQCCNMLRWHVAIVWPGLKRRNIQVFNKPTKTLQQDFPVPKFQPPKGNQRNVIYKIPCTSCQGSYSGETKRSFNTRRKERIRLKYNTVCWRLQCC